MIVSTMQAILDDAISSQQLQDHYLYLVGDGETICSIGQALNPIERLESHLGCAGEDRKAFSVNCLKQTDPTRWNGK